ncbi:MAG: uroporphyrinogen decarboxylase family protein [Planctomycetota bacterium]|nr:uroporphyrinogen decarboxylase family protein [Planctomycetota bacterium]MDP7129137.1 uroporphyrinogen decarboxylase family protein [Planctomycetota bacterium]
MQKSKPNSDTTSEPSPGIVPCRAGINYTIWERYEDRLDKLVEECPHVRIGGKEGAKSSRASEHKHRDEWGCLWHFPGMGLDGQVIEAPLDSWDKFDAWEPPSSAERVTAIREAAEERPADAPAPGAGTEHGFIFLRLTYLRGWDNFMLDVAEDSPRLYELRDIVADYWYALTEAHLDCGATHLGAADDLGMQDRLPISPASWRKLIKPAFQRVFGLARDRGASVSLHTDGCIVDVIPDLIEVGVTTLNPQDLVNGLDNLERLAKGKVSIALDVDRQSLTYLGTAEELDAHIRKCIRTLGSQEGGLSLGWGVYPGTPIENIEAICRAMQKYHDMWAN